MNLEDFENACLLNLQEGNVAFGSQPSYTSGSNYAQTTVDWAINRAYAKLLDDLADTTICSQTLSFASVLEQFAYPVPIGQNASATVKTFAAAGAALNGVVLTITVNGTAVTYTCTSSDGALSALQNLVTKVNANTTLVAAASPVINPMQQVLNAPSSWTVSAFSPGTAGNSITLTCSSSNTSLITFTASAATLSGGTAASPNIRTVQEVFYQPLGLTYNLRREPGVRLISWAEYQRKTASGYLQYFSAGTFPDYVALDTARKNLYLYPTPYEAGDTITVNYSPQLTNSASVSAANWGYLTNSTDSPPSSLPEDAQDCIWMYATFLLWPKAREIGTGLTYKTMYEEKLKQVIANYMQASQGASFGIRDAGDMQRASYGFFAN